MKLISWVSAATVLSLLPASLTGQEACPSPAPPAGVDPTSLADRGAILAYARGLTFHPAAHPTGETRRLTAISTPGPESQRRYRLGPMAGARPEACAHRITQDGLRSGRIVGMQILDGDYEKLHLPRGESFLWIDQLDGTMARGVVIPNDDRTAAAVVAIRVEFAPDMPARSFSEARWLFNPNDDDLWYACGPNECCIIPGGDPGGP